MVWSRKVRSAGFGGTGRSGARPSRRFPVSLGMALALVLPMVGVPASAGTARASQVSKAGSISRTLAGIYVTTGTREAFSTPAIADVTGDGRPDLVVAGLDGTVEAYSLPARSKLWSVSLGQTAIQGSPAVADFTGDGRGDVVVGTMDGRVVVLDGPSGAAVRTLYQGAPLHCPPGNDCRPDGFFASPALGDIDGDGRLDIVAASWDHSVYAWSWDGRLLWRRFLEDTLWSSPALADIDRNGTLEVILGGDIYAGNPLGVPAGGLVWVLERSGGVYGGYPYSIPGQTVWSSPAVGDLNGDGWPEVVVGTGTNFADPAGRQIHAFTAANRIALAGWPAALDGRAMGSPAIANIDGDNQLEVVTTSEGGSVYGLDTNGARLWRCGGCSSEHSSAAVADVDADGQQEVVSTTGHELKLLNASTGSVEASSGLSEGGWAPASTPTVAEIDGHTTIVTTKSDANLTVDVFTIAKPLCSAAWPTFGQNQYRTGRSSDASPLLWAPFVCPADFMAQQYQDFLGRKLDARGAAYWAGLLRSGRSGASIIESFMGSPEFGSVMAPVVRLNFTLFGGYPRSAAEVRKGATAIRNGRSIAAVADDLIAGSSLKKLDDRAFVGQIYLNLYGRAATAAELDSQTARLASGVSRGQLAAEHSEFSAPRLTAEVNVTMTYLGMLDRTPDGSGFTFWVGQARVGSLVNLIHGFQHSVEYRKRVM